MPRSQSSKPVRMIRDRRVVRLSRRFENFPVRGYVLDVGPRFFMLALVSDRIWFDGFECFRIADVNTVKPDPYATFVEAALKERGEIKPKKPRVSLETIEKLLLSANRAFPLVTIHREKVALTCAILAGWLVLHVAGSHYWKLVPTQRGNGIQANGA